MCPTGGLCKICIDNSGNSHGYLQRLREEFEQQTSKLSRRDITKARQMARYKQAAL